MERSFVEDSFPKFTGFQNEWSNVDKTMQVNTLGQKACSFVMNGFKIKASLSLSTMGCIWIFLLFDLKKLW